MFTKLLIMLKRRKCSSAGFSALPFCFVAMAVADGIELPGYFNIITNYLNITTNPLNIIANYLYIRVNMYFDAWFRGVNASKAQNY